ncbi:hypothetical protein FPRO04_14627, partial [Fusarium proliferatum]
MEVIGAELGFDGRLRRGRCIGHTINLSAKALLFGKNANAFEQQLSGAEALSDTEYAQWRKKGPVGKLHNIVVDVRISHRLIYLFKEVQKDEINRAATLKLRSKKPLKLIIDNDTRWLSQLYMIRRALRLKTSIELLLIKYKAQWEDENRSKKTGQVTQAKLAKKPRILRDENQLTDKDWEVLYHLEAILTVFETVVKTLEGDGHIRRRKQGWTGSYGNIWDVVLGYELLLNTLEEYKQLAADFPDPEHFRIGINLAWDKLDEYYQRLDETPIYYTAMALHPAYRWDWFDETWAHKPSWVEKAKEMVADVWLSDYAHLEVRTSSSRGDDEPPAKRPRFFNPFEKNSRLPNSKPAYAAIIVSDEYQAWQTDREASDGDFQDWQELPEQQRMGMSSKLLRDNPHIAAWHFYRRFGLFRDIVLKQKFNVTDYWNRYEWQGRGSSHCHGLFWMDGAPSVDLENEHTRKEFVRIWGSHVTALNPEPARVQQQGEGNPLAVNPLRHPLTFQWLSQILNRCQRHHCSETYCLRKKKDSEEISCRFFFPRDTRDTADVVRRQGQSYFSFEATRNDSLMNHYNRCLSLGWLANIDISPCTSLQAVINYAAKYCSKMEKRTDSYASLGRQILPYVSHHNPLLSFASRLMNKLLAERDFSGQEICHVLLNCELQEGTRVVRAVDCRPYEQQGRSLRLQGDHDDAEVVGIYDKYLSRPPLHEELTYLDFLANWNT